MSIDIVHNKLNNDSISQENGACGGFHQALFSVACQYPDKFSESASEAMARSDEIISLYSPHQVGQAFLALVAGSALVEYRLQHTVESTTNVDSATPEGEFCPRRSVLRQHASRNLSFGGLSADSLDEIAQAAKAAEADDAQRKDDDEKAETTTRARNGLFRQGASRRVAQRNLFVEDDNSTKNSGDRPDAIASSKEEPPIDRRALLWKQASRSFARTFSTRKLQHNDQDNDDDKNQNKSTGVKESRRGSFADPSVRFSTRNFKSDEKTDNSTNISARGIIESRRGLLREPSSRRFTPNMWNKENDQDVDNEQAIANRRFLVQSTRSLVRTILPDNSANVGDGNDKTESPLNGTDRRSLFLQQEQLSRAFARDAEENSSHETETITTATSETVTKEGEETPRGARSPITTFDSPITPQDEDRDIGIMEFVSELHDRIHENDHEYHGQDIDRDDTYPKDLPHSVVHHHNDAHLEDGLDPDETHPEDFHPDNEALRDDVDTDAGFDMDDAISITPPAPAFSRDDAALVWEEKMPLAGTNRDDDDDDSRPSLGRRRSATVDFALGGTANDHHDDYADDEDDLASVFSTPSTPTNRKHHKSKSKATETKLQRANKKLRRQLREKGTQTLQLQVDYRQLELRLVEIKYELAEAKADAEAAMLDVEDLTQQRDLIKMMSENERLELQQALLETEDKLEYFKAEVEASRAEILRLQKVVKKAEAWREVVSRVPRPRQQQQQQQQQQQHVLNQSSLHDSVSTMGDSSVDVQSTPPPYSASPKVVSSPKLGLASLRFRARYRQAQPERAATTAPTQVLAEGEGQISQ